METALLCALLMPSYKKDQMNLQPKKQMIFSIVLNQHQIRIYFFNMLQDFICLWTMKNISHLNNKHFRIVNKYNLSYLKVSIIQSCSMDKRKIYHHSQDQKLYLTILFRLIQTQLILQKSFHLSNQSFWYNLISEDT